MPAQEALKLLEQTLQDDELAGFKHRQLTYAAALPLWVNSEELPEAPEPPEWLAELMEDED